MSRRGWIIVLIAGGVGLAILIGVLGTRNEDSTTKSEAAASLCSSLQSLGSSLNTLTSLDPATATKGEFNSDVDAVQNDWNSVKSDAEDVQNASMGSLDSAWNNFENAVKSIPDDASVSDAVNAITQSANEFKTTAQTTAASVNCT